MKIEDCYFLGNITKPFGYKGEVDIFLDVDNPRDYENLDSVFVEIKGKLVPFFIEYIRLKNKHAIVLFQDIKNENIDALINSKLYLPLSSLPQLSGNNFYYHEIKGFAIKDKAYGELGILIDIMDNGPQAIFQINHPSGKEILMPILDDFIENVDREHKTITTKAPDGLIDFYLNG